MFVRRAPLRYGITRRSAVNQKKKKTLQVANVRQIVSTPSRLKSTSLVLAIGLDHFIVCVPPLGTLNVLSTGCSWWRRLGRLGIVRPAVGKQLRGR
ncbi:hypothetical protein M404DRAFT_135563 [Pisolithus tinctorius Marx 270]|uniref:ER membrane protein complex subunit 1 C-terminal domain-containing protein n=1 Tax=Pisolithus tinctorius Marx 270 TaxID=870435 RepID=A0A0C3JFM3_PISTI|nr:hypothetical protein M404DRAFT_135563 [Pisolithus tinctorius Marx 270]